MLAEKLRDASPGTSTPRSPNNRTPPSGGCLNAADISEEPEDGYDGSPYKGSSYGSYAAAAPLPPKNGHSTPTTMMPTIIPAPRPASWASSPSSGGGSLASRSPSMKASVAMKDRRPSPVTPPPATTSIRLPALSAEAEWAPSILEKRPPTTLRVLTWNVWLSSTRLQERMAALFSELLRDAPDVACLQEVLPELAEAVRRSAALLRVYDVSTNVVMPYGNLLLVRKSLRAFIREIKLPSTMGRKLTHES